MEELRLTPSRRLNQAPNRLQVQVLLLLQVQALRLAAMTKPHAKAALKPLALRWVVGHISLPVTTGPKDVIRTRAALMQE